MRKHISLADRFGPMSFYKSALMIALPVMARALIQNLVSLIDNFMVAGLGDIKMAGVNITGQIIFLFMVFFNTVCMAGGIFMTQFFGAKDKQGMRQTFIFKLIAGTFIVALYMFSCFVIPDKILSLMVKGNAQADLILEQGIAYMKVMGWMGIPWLFSMMIGSSLREIGEVKIPLVISVIATLVNTFFNWCFIYGNLGCPRLEVRGAAIATIIARSIEALIFIGYVVVKKPDFAIILSNFVHINFKLFRNILQKAWMMICSEMLWAIAETVTTALYNGRGGADVVSGMSASFAIANLFFVAFGGICTATGVILGKNLGSGNLKQARTEKVWLLNGANVFGVFMTFFGLATMFLVPIVFKNLSPNSQKICSEMVFIMALYMPAWVYINGQFSVSRAGGDTIMGMLVDGIANGCIVIPGIFFMARCTTLGPVAMYAIIKAVEFPKIWVAGARLNQEKWVVNLAEKNAISG